MKRSIVKKRKTKKASAILPAQKETTSPYSASTLSAANESPSESSSQSEKLNKLYDDTAISARLKNIEGSNKYLLFLKSHEVFI